MGHCVWVNLNILTCINIGALLGNLKGVRLLDSLCYPDVNGYFRTSLQFPQFNLSIIS